MSSTVWARRARDIVSGLEVEDDPDAKDSRTGKANEKRIA
jgi:hypothetical protein